MTDLTLENNPVEKTTKFHALIKDKFPSVLYLNLQKFTLPTAAPAKTSFFEGGDNSAAKDLGKGVPEVEVKQSQSKRKGTLLGIGGLNQSQPEVGKTGLIESQGGLIDLKVRPPSSNVTAVA